MKTGLFDVNNTELNIGDQYKAKDSTKIFTVYFKGGAVCGGTSFEKSMPLGWEEDDCELNLSLNLNWLTIVDLHLTSNEFIKLAIKFLNYSFDDISYSELTELEKTYCSEQEYILLLKFIDNYEKAN